jgi:RAB protein geranylgeranyltransferase component A
VLGYIDPLGNDSKTDIDRINMQVPSSKEDVFKNQSVSLIDKRRLMKLMTSAISYEPSEEDSGVSLNMSHSKLDNSGLPRFCREKLRKIPT